MSIQIREASSDDWYKLQVFFQRIYRKDHPLQTKEFWEWQYGNVDFGRSFICVNEEGSVVGHVGANFAGGIAWIINVYLDEKYRGQGILKRFYDLARNYYPLGATAANDAGLGLYQKMRWIRYHNLIRMVKVNPSIKNPNFHNCCKSLKLEIEDLSFKDSHYFKQPSIKGIMLQDGSTAVSQEDVGGIRIVDIKNIQEMEDHAWNLGYLWMDYLTSWNDLKLIELKKQNWKVDYKNAVPWRLNPIKKGYYCDVTFLSEQSLDNEFIVHRSFSDHGRVGSLKS